MKKLLALLGFGVGMLVSFGFGCAVGTVVTNDYYNDRLDATNKVDKECIDFIRNMEKAADKSKSSKKRSDILREHAVMLAEQGCSAEEIKIRLDDLRNKLD